MGQTTDTQTDKERAVDLEKLRVASHRGGCRLFGPFYERECTCDYEVRNNAADLIESLSTRLAALEEQLRKYQCPIGMTNGSDICSAASCPECLLQQFVGWRDRAKAAESALAAERAKVVEECAKVCDDRLEQWTKRNYFRYTENQISADHELDACAAAIRALSPRKEQG